MGEEMTTTLFIVLLVGGTTAPAMCLAVLALQDVRRYQARYLRSWSECAMLRGQSVRLAERAVNAEAGEALWKSIATMGMPS